MQVQAKKFFRTAFLVGMVLLRGTKPGASLSKKTCFRRGYELLGNNSAHLPSHD
jgi:hypothetical protein